jgi:hypothetical protein
VIEVGHDKMDVQFILQFIEDMEKTNRIRPSRDGDDDAVAFGDHSVARDGVFNLLEGLSGIVHTELKIPLCPPLPKGEGKVLPFVKGR